MKKIVLIIILWLLISQNVYAAEEPDWSEYDFSGIESELRELERGDNYYNDGIQFDSFLELVKKLADGSVQLGFSEIVGQFFQLVIKEIREQWRLMLELAALLILSGFLKNLNLAFGNSQVEQIAFYVLFGTAITLVFQSFLTAYQLAVSTGEKLSAVLLSLLPVMGAIQAASGGQIFAAVQSGLLFSGVNFALWLIQNVFFTGILLFVLFGTVNQLTGQNMLKRITSLTRVLVQKGLKGASAVFLVVMSLNGVVASAADTWMKKTMVSAAGAVPVVGNALGGAVSTIFAGASLVGKCVGSGGMVILFCLCMIPIAKLVTLWLMYKLMNAILSPIAEPKLAELIEAAADGVGMLIGVIVVLMGMFMCGVGIFLRSM